MHLLRICTSLYLNIKLIYCAQFIALNLLRKSRFSTPRRWYTKHKMMILIMWIESDVHIQLKIISLPTLYYIMWTFSFENRRGISKPNWLFLRPVFIYMYHPMYCLLCRYIFSNLHEMLVLHTVRRKFSFFRTSYSS